MQTSRELISSETDDETGGHKRRKLETLVMACCEEGDTYWRAHPRGAGSRVASRSHQHREPMLRTIREAVDMTVHPKSQLPGNAKSWHALYTHIFCRSEF